MGMRMALAVLAETDLISVLLSSLAPRRDDR
jgi:hypothetical protein